MKVEKLTYSGIKDKQLPIFLEKHWVNTFSSINNVEYTYFGIKKKDDLKVVFGLYIKNKNQAVQIPLSYYHPLVFFLEPRKRVNEYRQKKNSYLNIISQFLNKNFSKIYFNLDTNVVDGRPFIWNNINILNYYTFVINFQNFDKNNYTSTTKKAINKANKEDISLSKKIDFDKFWELNKITFARQHKEFPYTHNQLQKIFDILSKKNFLIQYNAKINGAIKGIRIIAVDRRKNVLYDFLAASDYEGLKSGINSWLI
ncbi:MAG: hypothetical protein U9N34_01080, partial [Candidatus Cloacimonadota bacterium]|nr:hypothetical protein [Candidatus Cloacimonadota bacterium]